MNNQLIEKVIKSNSSNACPEFTYENPLLDRNIAAALAKSFVKILCVSQQDSNINNNLRYSVLSNIRKICRVEPENHLEVDDNLTNSLKGLYVDKMKDLQENISKNSITKELDEYLLRKMKEVDLNSKYQFSMNSEVVQALLNLSKRSSDLELLSKNVLHWNVSDKKSLALVKNLWNNPNLSQNNSGVLDDICLKMKSEIEIILLDLCHSVVTDPNLQIEVLFATSSVLIDLIKKCSQSPQCFQICSRILNYLFVSTNYNQDMQHFISLFVQNVNKNCSNSISKLYPEQLSSIVILLDIDLNIMPQQLKSKYVDQTMVYLKTFHEETELILLLSHFPDWFHIYCDLGK